MSYYTTLFSDASATSNSDLLANFKALITPLSDEDCALINGPFTLEEIEHALDQLPLSKTFGPDGISCGFYKTFQLLLSPILLQIFALGFDVGFLPQSFTRKHTVLIPKSTDKEKLLSVDGYRPITLANVDYKIFAKVLSNRLQYAMTVLIGPHQTCGLSGHSIQNNMHIARTIIEYYFGFYEQLALLQIDLAKAFDRVGIRFYFLFSSVQMMNQLY